MVLILVLLHSMVHVLISARSAARDSHRLLAMERLRKALVRYTQAHSGHLPHERWCEAIRPYEATLDADLAVDARGDGVGFAMMPKMIGQVLPDLKPTVLLLVEYRGLEKDQIAYDPGKLFVRPGASYLDVSTVEGESRRPFAKVRAQIADRK